MFGKSKNLGLAVTEQGISAALVGFAGQRRTVLRTAWLPFTDEVNLGKPDELSRAFKDLLNREDMGASGCVIGLAAGWIASREKLLPPTDRESLRGALSIAAEREFASGAGDLAFDYVATESAKGTVAMLAAAPRQVIDPLLQMARAAGLAVTAVTSSTLALAVASRGVIVAGGRLVLCLLPGGVELAVQTSGGLRMLRHLSVRLQSSADGVGGLCRELGRVLSLAPPPHGAAGPGEAIVWDSLGLDRPTLESIGRQLDMPARICKLPGDLGCITVSGKDQTIDCPGGTGFPACGPISQPGKAVPPNFHAQAAALAACDDPSVAMDFLHSRLAAPTPSRFGRRTVWTAAAAAVLFVAGGAMLVDYFLQSREAAALETELTNLKAPAEQAKRQVEDFAFVQGWYDRRPNFLECLKAISLAFPRDDKSWATYLRAKEDMHVELSVKAVNEEAALEVLDRLKSSPRLGNVTPMFIRQSGDKSGEVSFDVLMDLKGGR